MVFSFAQITWKRWLCSNNMNSAVTHDKACFTMSTPKFKYRAQHKINLQYSNVHYVLNNLSSLPILCGPLTLQHHNNDWRGSQQQFQLKHYSYMQLCMVIVYQSLHVQLYYATIGICIISTSIISYSGSCRHGQTSSEIALFYMGVTEF